ncbi:hypothetical protein [Variovorax paradoxus]|uniref:hypothetical protein n=1 Tax=Variovorax paradoxus TaxID=34073 RepID=UPI003D65E7A6
MALDMELEMSGNSKDWAELDLILEEIGLSHVEVRDASGVRAVLGSGELTVGTAFGQPRRDGQIRAEGMHGCTFKVNANAEFRINNSMYDEAVATIKTVLTRLTERTDMLFVLSFQYEEVRAIRDRERGFEWFWNDSR